MDDTTAEPRAKRQKKDKFGRFAALERLKQLKGSKHKYEIDAVENVYDTVDEVEYTKKVLRQQEADFIVDDDGSGYIEDGRDIFDDDLDTESIAQASKGKGSKRKKKTVSENAGKGNLQYMLSTMPNKKKEEVVLDNDDVLSELISEIDDPKANVKTEKTTVKPQMKFSLLAEKKAAKDYMKSFMPTKSSVNVETKVEVEDVIEKDKENVVVDEVVKEEASSIMPEMKPAAKSKLLFKIEEPKIVKEEQASVVEPDEMLNMVDFDDDFDFEIEDEVPVKQEAECKITEEQLLEGCTFSANSHTVEADVEQDSAPEFLDVEDKEGFLFYWWDAYEDQVNQPGVILLFGKTFSEEQKKYISCCVVVKNVQRKIYLLPRPYHLDKNNQPTDNPVSIIDVYQEFNNYTAEMFNLQSYKSKTVTKNYVFNPEVPTESEYLEIRYEGPMNFSGRTFKTFSHVFGLNSSFLEILLLERKIKGPCWLKVSNTEISTNPFTYTALEVKCFKPTDVTVIQSSNPLPPPPLVVLALNIKIANINSGKNEIAMISCLVNNNYQLNKKTPNPPFQEHFCVFTKLSDQALPFNIHIALSKYKATKVQKMDTERALLNYFLAQFSKIDPDLIVGHDLNGYQISVLSERLQIANATNFSRFSRIKRTNANFNKFKLERQLFSGRLVCDIKISAKELIRSRSYDLDALCAHILKVPENQRIEIEEENVPKMYESSIDLFKMVSLTMQDTSYILKIMYELNVIPLSLQITNIAGNIMSRTLMGGRSERNEFLLLHAFYEKDYIVPEKQIKNKGESKVSNSKRKKPTYSGGLVLDPKVGFYDHLILLMDFNSLYPSIIQEYNICFTTITDAPNEEEVILPDKSVPPGILPTEIRKLVESRRQVKNLMKNPHLSPDVKMQYHIRQKALKLTANSMYGCLGFSNSRFFAKDLAALVTQKGREILTNTKDIVKRLNYDVIYGDTDSIMINTNNLDYEQVIKIGKSIKVEINKLYRQVELDIDGVFKYLLLLKKKKYAAVSLQKDKNGKLQEIQELKGLDIVRRDWSQLAAEAGKFILNQILSNQTADERIENIHNHLEKLKMDIEASKVPIPLLVITKQLTKDPHLYADKNSLPHVQVALRHNKKQTGKKFKAGDTVPYIICKDGTNNSPTLRAYLVEELKASNELSIDSNYYLAHQIHPVISRICEPIDGTDSYQIASVLGLDMNSFKRPVETNQEAVYENFTRPEVRFRNVEPFMFNCFSCKEEIKMSLCINTYTLDKCRNLKCAVRPVEYLGYIQNQLTLQIRKFIQKYYLSELTCEDPACANITTRIPQKFASTYPVCTMCRKGVMYRVYSEKDLYSQILYFRHIFDLRKLEKKVDPKLEIAYNTLKEYVDNVLQHSAYATINLDELFAPIFKGGNSILQLDPTQIHDDDANDEDL